MIFLRVDTILAHEIAPILWDIDQFIGLRHFATHRLF